LLIFQFLPFQVEKYRNQLVVEVNWGGGELFLLSTKTSNRFKVINFRRYSNDRRMEIGGNVHAEI
jgi:hypothetical protein